MSNAFQRHGIKHLSPTRCNKFAAQPALFVLEDLLKKRAPVGIAAHRGTAIEHAVSAGLYDKRMTVETCAEIAQNKLMSLSRGFSDEAIKKEYDALGGYVEQGLLALRPYGVPDNPPDGAWNGQIEVSTSFPDVAVPFKGYLDFRFSGHGLIIDLKTTLRAPSSISYPHWLQGSFYDHCAGNFQVKFVYATPKKSVEHAIENRELGVEAIRRIGVSMQNFLSLSDDPKILAAICAPDYSQFYWNHPKAKEHAKEVFGY